MAITVNGDPLAHESGLTVEQLLAKKKYSFPLKIVYVGDKRIPKAEYATTIVEDGSVVRVIHMMTGG